MKTKVLPILNYHAIEDAHGRGSLDFRQRDYALGLGAFREQMDHLAREGYRSLSSQEILAWFGGARERPAPGVGLTFDDGLISHYESVLPELSARNFRGIFFVTPAFLGAKGYMNWGHLRELLKRGHEIGSHGLTHRPLTYASPLTLWQELAESKNLIEDNLGVKVDLFSVPRAYYNAEVGRVAEMAGYRLVFTSFADVNRRRHGAPRSFNRIAIKPGLKLNRFRRRIRGGCSCHPGETVKAFLRATVPPGVYDLAATLKQFLSGRGRS